MAEVSWADYLTCEVCGAAAGRPCRTRSGGGPQALPDLHADRPHSSRPRAAAAKRRAGTC